MQQATRRYVYVTFADPEDDNSFPVFTDQIAERGHGWWSYSVNETDLDGAKVYDGKDRLVASDLRAKDAIAIVDAMNALPLREGLEQQGGV